MNCVVLRITQFDGLVQGLRMSNDRGHKRSSKREVVVPWTTAGGVGGRHGVSGPSQVGGGYQGIQSVSNFCAKPDLRMAEFRAMGLQASLLRAAEVIGVDSFLAFWRIIDQDPAFRTEKGDINLRMRPYRSYLRFQRNRYIDQLTVGGWAPAAIQQAVRLNLCERISLRHIYRIMASK